MDKIKKIFSSSNNADNTYESEQTSNTTHTGTSYPDTTNSGATQAGTTRTGGLTGEGSHLVGATSGNTAGYTRQHGTSTGAGATGAAERQASLIQVKPTSSNSHRELHKHENTSLGSTTLGSGASVTGSSGQDSRISTGGDVTTTTDPHSSNLANEVDPQVDSGNSRSFPLSNTGTTSTNTGSGCHLGRDTAAVGAAGAAGEGIHRHENERNLGTGTGYAGTSSTGQDLPDRTGSSVTDANTSSGHHLGRDAAAVGTAGPVGAGVTHHHHGNVGSTNTRSGEYHTVPGPHSTDTANRLDPRVNTAISGYEDAINHSHKHGGGAEQADRDHPTGNVSGTSHVGQLTGSSGHHLGRDTAVGVGAAGVAKHEHDKHRDGQSTGFGSTSTTTGTPGTSTQHGLHSDNRGGISGQSASTTTGSSGHHLGRDTAVGTGTIGDAGLASHSLRQDGARGSLTEGDFDQNGQPIHHSNIRTHEYADQAQHSSGTHHIGRDAGIGTGVGGAAYEDDKHRHGHAGSADPTQSSNNYTTSPSQQAHEEGLQSGLAQHHGLAEPRKLSEADTDQYGHVIGGEGTTDGSRFVKDVVGGGGATKRVA